MAKRKSLSKKVRFEVLKRDSFTCQYCSSKPPRVPLEVDHIIPVSKGGTNDINNLITSCFDCNRGKSNIELTSIPESLVQRNERKSLAVDQYNQYKRLLKKEKKQMESDIDIVESVFSLYNENMVFTDKFRISVKSFIKSLGIESVQDAMERACIKTSDGAIKYFCGICWSRIRENEG